MSVSVGKSYHIKDSFFSLVNDSKLMVNKEGNNCRPHFFFFEDTKTKGIYWAVPQSTKIAKYQAIIQQKIAKYDKCNTIVIGNFGGQDNAFLIQNMFPGKIKTDRTKLSNREGNSFPVFFFLEKYCFQY